MSNPVNILIVDDLSDKLLSLQTVLEELGQNLVLVSSGREALRKLTEQEFAVILLDVNMPEMDGFETAALIRQRRRTAHTPIIFITAFGDDMHTARGYSLGAVDYILSPVVPEVLRTKVGVFVELYRKTEEVKLHAEQRIELVRAQAARAAAEQATRRSQFLAEASAVLSGSLSFDATVTGIARQVVPYFGNLGAVLVHEGAATLGRAVFAWTTPAQAAVAERKVASHEIHPALLEAAAQLMTLEHTLKIDDAAHGPHGLPLLAPDVTESLAATPLPRESGPGLLLPLFARGRMLGALLVARGEPGTPLSADEESLAQDLAGRAAIALDNARLYSKIQMADQRKNDFLAMLAHELRNPLAPICNAVHILRHHEELPHEQGWAHDLIDRQVQNLVRLVDDLLDVSRITRGKIQLQKEVIEIARVVASAVETSGPMIAARRHELVVTLQDEPVYVDADSTRLAQVLTNLLNNAAKYTEPGGRIDLHVVPDGDEIVVTVRDSGVGICPELLDQIFDIFFQVDRSLDRSQGGLGIGLTMVSRLVEMHGGNVRAHSNGANQGSEFIVRLPAASPPQPTLTTMHTDFTRVAQQPCRILIVDDNRDAAQTLAAVLGKSKHDTRVAHDGTSALRACNAFHPDIALLDIGLPEMDGYELAQRIRIQPWSEKTTLVAITGYGQEEDKTRASQVGFDHHLVKPVAPKTLLELIGAIQRQHTNERTDVVRRA